MAKYIGIAFVLRVLWDLEKQSFGGHSMDHFKRLLCIKLYITETLKSLFLPNDINILTK